MRVLVKNTGSVVEIVEIYHPRTLEKDAVFVMPGGRVSLPHNWRVKATVRPNPKLVITGNDAPVSPLDL